MEKSCKMSLGDIFVPLTPISHPGPLTNAKPRDSLSLAGLFAVMGKEDIDPMPVLNLVLLFIAALFADYGQVGVSHVSVLALVSGLHCACHTLCSSI
jgi:hypothetical protein